MPATAISMKPRVKWRNDLGVWTLLMHNLVGDIKLYQVTKISKSGDISGVLLEEHINA